jgi:hypothetical protein
MILATAHNPWNLTSGFSDRGFLLYRDNFAVSLCHKKLRYAASLFCNADCRPSTANAGITWFLNQLVSFIPYDNWLLAEIVDRDWLFNDFKNGEMSNWEADCWISWAFPSIVNRMADRSGSDFYRQLLLLGFPAQCRTDSHEGSEKNDIGKDLAIG